MASTRGADAVLVHTLVENPDFDNLAELTKQIEYETVKFIEGVDELLSVRK